MISQVRIMNPQAFINIFKYVPNFRNSELMEVKIRRDGPSLCIRLSTKEMVKVKPKRWNKWDVIYVEMSFLGIKDLEVNGLDINNNINKFEIENIDENGILEIKYNNGMYIKCSFDWARVEKITPGLLGELYNPFV